MCEQTFNRHGHATSACVLDGQLVQLHVPIVLDDALQGRLIVFSQIAFQATHLGMWDINRLPDAASLKEASKRSTCATQQPPHPHAHQRHARGTITKQVCAGAIAMANVAQEMLQQQAVHVLANCAHDAVAAAEPLIIAACTRTIAQMAVHSPRACPPTCLPHGHGRRLKQGDGILALCLYLLV